MKYYQVDPSLRVDYLQNFSKRKNQSVRFTGFLLFSLMLLFGILTYRELPFFAISLFFVTITMVTVAYFAYGRMYANQKEQLESLLNGKYAIDDYSLKFLAPDPLAREF